MMEVSRSWVQSLAKNDWHKKLSKIEVVILNCLWSLWVQTLLKMVGIENFQKLIYQVKDFKGWVQILAKNDWYHKL